MRKAFGNQHPNKRVRIYLVVLIAFLVVVHVALLVNAWDMLVNLF